MNCAQVKPKIRDYLEDLHGEPDRDQIRQHLADCPVCHGFAAQLGTYASDLIRMAQAPVPFDLTEAYLSDPDMELGENFKFPKTALGLGILFVSIIAFTVVAPRLYQVSKSVEAPVKEEEPDSLILLRKMAEDLGVEVKRNGEMKESLAVKLRPFHWHMKFQNPSNEPVFLKKLEELKIEIMFQTENFLVIQPDQEQLASLVAFLKPFKEPGIQSVVAGIKNLPTRFEPVRISVVMESASPDPAVLHWHLQFTLPNRLAFLQWLRDQGYKLVYTESEIWVVEIRSEQEYTLLKIQIQDTAGLIAEIGLKNPGDSVPEKIIFYLRD